MTQTVSAQQFTAHNIPNPRVYQYAIRWVAAKQPDDVGAPPEYYTFCRTSMDTVGEMARLSLEGHELISEVGWNESSKRFAVFTSFIHEEKHAREPEHQMAGA